MFPNVLFAILYTSLDFVSIYCIVYRSRKEAAYEATYTSRQMLLNPAGECCYRVTVLLFWRKDCIV